MAATVIEGSNGILREALKCSLRGASVAASAGCWNCAQGAKRYLLTEDTVQLQTFQQQKLATVYRMYGKKDTYYRTIENKLDKNHLILRDELKMLLHLCQTKDEVELIKRVIHRYHEQNKNVAFGEFKFGPLFMRLCYELNLEASALELIKDQALNGFFSDSTSFNILMDLLFTKGHYERALEVLLEMKRQNVKFTSETYLLAVAICYKLNNSESCKMCTTILEDAEIKGKYISRRLYYFATAFALNQSDVGRARSYYSRIMNTETRICTNLKILLQAASGELEDLINTLEIASEATASNFVKKTEFCMEVLTKAREKVEDDQALCIRFENVFAKLQAFGQIISLTLDDLLCQTPRIKRRYTELLNKSQVSRRTLKPLHSALLAE